MSCCDNKKVKSIIAGWGNYVFRTPETEAIAIQRAKVCAVCLQMKKIKTNWCPICKCFIPAKIRSMAEKCPAGLWLAEGMFRVSWWEINRVNRIDLVI